jgi:hypothetical protein
MHGKSQWHIFMHLDGNKKLAWELQMQKMDHHEIGLCMCLDLAHIKRQQDAW